MTNSLKKCKKIPATDKDVFKYIVVNFYISAEYIMKG